MIRVCANSNRSGLVIELCHNFDPFFSVGISWYQIAARDDTLSESMYVRLDTVEVRLDVAVVANQPK